MCGSCLFSVLLAAFSLDLWPYRELWLFTVLGGCGYNMLSETLGFLNEGFDSPEAGSSRWRLLCVPLCAFNLAACEGLETGVKYVQWAQECEAGLHVLAGWKGTGCARSPLQSWPWAENLQHRRKECPVTFPPGINFIKKKKQLIKQYILRNVYGPCWFLLAVPLLSLTHADFETPIVLPCLIHCFSALLLEVPFQWPLLGTDIERGVLSPRGAEQYQSQDTHFNPFLGGRVFIFKRTEFVVLKNRHFLLWHPVIKS